MASTSGKKTSSSGKSTAKSSTTRSSTAKSSAGRHTANSSTRRNSSTKSSATDRKRDPYQAARDSELFREIGLIILFVAMVILFLCNFGVIGPVGDTVSGVMFGLFGFTSYIVPIVLFVAVAFWFANEGSPTAVRKMIAGTVLFFMIGVVCDLIAGSAAKLEYYDLKALYQGSMESKNGGGCLAGSLSYLLQLYLETIGTVLVVLLCAIISVILLTERSLLRGMQEGRSRLREEAEYRREVVRVRREELEEQDRQRRAALVSEKKRRAEVRRQKEEEREDEKILRMNKRVTGVMIDTALEKPATKRRDDIHEITLEDLQDSVTQDSAVINPTNNVMEEKRNQTKKEVAFDFDRIRVRSAHQITMEEVSKPQEPVREASIEEEEEPYVRKEDPVKQFTKQEVDAIQVHSEATAKAKPTAKLAEDHDSKMSPQELEIRKEMQNKAPKKYMFPPLSRLQRGNPVTADSTRELKETALRLQQTLSTFGVNVTITDISQGPSVTRYELQPEQGVKVSKIVNLADDIKLNLAATDIRIEAPIPGKAAIGIEVPNKENSPVALRDLLESSKFRDFPSNLAFAVGKDIAGQTVVADIAKMPHMLIAGATGSGKSVCINTLIMSILYKSHPDDVKLIMVDPKVVELSVYNGIPHLLIPVVTDPKKASAALHWGVSEMTDRYKKFADFNVRDLKGYNKKVEAMREQGQEDAPAKMPQIVIIVDELADLMMVSPGEVEESICRLAQLARAAGIHLIIATQRPSVDVITGLIKANMPSRVAFSVSSGVDSRTILDMNGAEKLLGKGDMLFYPQGYSKPARVQGAFVSDKEVSDVVDFLKNQAIGNTYAEEIEEQIKNIGSGSTGSGASSQAEERDEYFAEAGRFIIDKDKASIGMLQRVFKIGFNRAARIMDQLAEYGVVGEEEGTKPRKVLMSMEQFEQLLEEI